MTSPRRAFGSNHWRTPRELEEVFNAADRRRKWRSKLKPQSLEEARAASFVERLNLTIRLKLEQ